MLNEKRMMYLVAIISDLFYLFDLTGMLERRAETAASNL